MKAKRNCEPLRKSILVYVLSALDFRWNYKLFIVIAKPCAKYFQTIALRCLYSQ